MYLQTQLVTFSSSAVQAAPVSAGYGSVIYRIYVEPLMSNGDTMYVGASNVTNDGSGVGVISELPMPGQNGQQSPTFWENISHTGSNQIDPTVFYFHGTSGEKAKVTYFIV